MLARFRNENTEGESKKLTGKVSCSEKVPILEQKILTIAAEYNHFSGNLASVSVNFSRKSKDRDLGC